MKVECGISAYLRNQSRNVGNDSQRRLQSLNMAVNCTLSTGFKSNRCRREAHDTLGVTGSSPVAPTASFEA
jgi:hypothetical protein